VQAVRLHAELDNHRADLPSAVRGW
jgi:hypothetical protein